LKKLALIVSGRGSTALQIIRSCCAAGETLRGLYDPALVIATRTNTYVSQSIMPYCVNVVVWGAHERETPEQADHTLLRLLEAHEIEVVGLYGCTIHIPPRTVERYRGMMINQHPGPLDPGRPDSGGHGMYGRRVHQAWLDYIRQVEPRSDRRFTEASAQFVSDQYDHGDVVYRRVLPVLPDDDPVTLAERLSGVEYGVQAQALWLLAHGMAHPLVRDRPLVEGELNQAILNQCKASAMRVWPRG
jgi:phosphoribosylglycinamide formyltransferase-1